MLYNRGVEIFQTWVSALGPVLQPLLGGVLIGVAAALLWILEGRVAGISGIAGGVFDAPPGDRGWRWVFLLGLLAGGAVMWRLLPGAFGAAGGADAAASASASTSASAGALALPVIAGLLVGVGTTLSRGCTSGHGVCGISRLSTRSIAATCTFMAAGALTALVAGQLLRGGQ
jgi:uncharacterized membrane protein YedE/YeeE